VFKFSSSEKLEIALKFELRHEFQDKRTYVLEQIHHRHFLLAFALFELLLGNKRDQAVDTS